MLFNILVIYLGFVIIQLGLCYVFPDLMIEMKKVKGHFTLSLVIAPICVVVFIFWWIYYSFRAIQKEKR